MAAFVEGIQALYTADAIFRPDRPVLGAFRRVAAGLGISDAVCAVRGLGMDLVDSSPFVKVSHCVLKLYVLKL